MAVVLFPFPPTLSKMVASSPVLTFELCRSVLCWCLTGFWGLKFWKWHQHHSSVRIYMHTPLTVRMPLLRLNRVTSSASRSVLKLSARALWYISGHLHDIGYPLPESLASTETMTLVCFPRCYEDGVEVLFREGWRGDSKVVGGWFSWWGKVMLYNAHIFLTTTVFVNRV